MLTVVIPTHNPNLARLEATLVGLRNQTLSSDSWEVLIVDNASSKFPDRGWFDSLALSNLTIVKEPTLGLTSARRQGLITAKGSIVVFVDDDNVLASDYLAVVSEIFLANSRLGAIGGRSIGSFEKPIENWHNEIIGMLAIRDLGEKEIIVADFYDKGLGRNEYPICAPIGAGIALRLEAANAWLNALETEPWRKRFDRTGNALTSGGDNDIVMTVMENGWSVGYFPKLALKHLIPASRLEVAYLARLNRAMQRSWMQALSVHNANPWPPIKKWTVLPRVAKAWLLYRPWTSPLARIRWEGARGHFEGRSTSLSSTMAAISNQTAPEE